MVSFWGEVLGGHTTKNKLDVFGVFLCGFIFKPGFFGLVEAMVIRVDPMELVLDGSQLNGKIFGPKLVTRNGDCSMDEEPSWDDFCFMARMVLGFALTSQKCLHLHLFKMLQ